MPLPLPRNRSATLPPPSPVHSGGVPLPFPADQRASGVAATFPKLSAVRGIAPLQHPAASIRPVRAPFVAYRGAALLPAGNVSRRLLLGLCTLPGMGGVGDSTSAQVAAHNATAGLTRGSTAEDRRRAGLTGRRAGLAVGSAFGGLGVGSVADASATSEGAARLSGYLARAYAPSTNKKDAGSFLAWERACAKMGTTPWRTDMAANSGADPDGYAEEVYVAAMGVVLMYDEMRPRAHVDPAADPRNATKKYGAVIRIHSCLWPPVKMVPTSVVANVVKGMMRVFIDRHGFKSLIPRRKLPLTNELLAAMFGIYEGATRGALVFVSAAYEWIAFMALFMVLAESGERKDEVSGDKGRNGFTFASLTWKIGGVLYNALTPALAARLSKGDGVYLAHGLAKNDPFGAFFTATPSFLPWRAAGRCACRALCALEAAAAVPPSKRGDTPLFGPAMGKYFSAAQVDAAFLLLLSRGANVPDAELSDYSVHSFRIFVACALLTSGCPRWLIKRMLRWRGDESLDIYARVSDQDWDARLSGTLDATVDATVVPRLPKMDFSPEQESAFLAMAHSLLGASVLPDPA